MDFIYSPYFVVILILTIIFIPIVIILIRYQCCKDKTLLCCQDQHNKIYDENMDDDTINENIDEEAL
jgi:hypothetical protein